MLESVLTSRRGPISQYGVEIVRNNINHIQRTGYGFTEKSRTLSAPISSMLGNCSTLPNEWSLLITFKPGGISSTSQYILTLLEANNQRNNRFAQLFRLVPLLERHFPKLSWFYPE